MVKAWKRKLLQFSPSGVSHRCELAHGLTSDPGSGGLDRAHLKSA